MVWDIVSTVVPALVMALFVNVYVVQAMVIDGPSMQPNLYYDYRIVVEKISYRFASDPHRGDVMVFDLSDEDVPLIKRVVALAGETVAVRNGRVYVDEELLEESWITRTGGPNYPPKTVPPGHVFVLGDNRGISRDSRAFGPVAVEKIVGRAVLIVIFWVCFK